MSLSIPILSSQVNPHFVLHHYLNQLTCLGYNYNIFLGNIFGLLPLIWGGTHTLMALNSSMLNMFHFLLDVFLIFQ